MIVSWNWLKDYVTLDMSSEQLEERLTMSGLNHEGTEEVGADLAIDLEVTSNRPDCLGHIGVAREIAVLWDRELSFPNPEPKSGKTPVGELTSVAIDCPELCSRYTARVIRGVKIGPSPDWLQERLKTLGIARINNVVDISNYVLMECGQPLHVFDFAKLQGGKILVREAQPGEKFEAIDHNTYELAAGTCVIADAARPVALGGVMGGAETEVSSSSTDLLIESAEFAPLSIRNTARKLNLHSPSSYRFERGVDPEGVDWASRRCCELILDLAGGELAKGVIDVGSERPPVKPVVLRFAQLKRILGIDIAPDEVRRIFASLGMQEAAKGKDRVEVVPPTWRRDITREADLIEEAARIHGYDKIPEDVGVAMTASSRSDDDRLLERVRRVLAGGGFDEAMTLSAVDETTAQAFSPWTDEEPLRCSTPVLRRADLLRRSIVPSLLASRRTNEALGNPRIELFEIAKVYLPRKGQLPLEEMMIGLTSGRDYRSIKGALEAIAHEASPEARLEVREFQSPILQAGKSAELWLKGEQYGFLGELSPEGQKQFELRGPATIGEVRLSALMAVAKLIRRHAPLSAYPAVSRDLNIVCYEPMSWSQIESVVRDKVGELLESLEYLETYRDPKHLGGGDQSLLFRVVLRSTKATLTRKEADDVLDEIVAKLETDFDCYLRSRIP